MKHLLKNILIAVAGGALVLFLAVFFVASGFHQSPPVQSVVDTVASLTKPPKVVVASGIPVRLTIPGIKVDANVIQVGLLPDGSVDSPKGPSDTAWYNLGPKPGEKGSSVIVGHYGQWQNGQGSVFDNLNKLKKGDKIYVKNDKGEVVTFAVREIKTYSPSDVVPDIFNKKDGTYLNLITCGGTWIPGKKTYDKRLVVFTDLVPN